MFILKNQITKEAIKKLMATPEKIKGTSFKGEMEYVLGKEGEEGLKAVEKETKRLGYPIKYNEIKDADWYPIGLKIVSLCAILNIFHWGEKEVAEIAEAAPKVSFVVRFFMKYFTSPEKIFRMAASRMWERYYNVGSLEAVDFKRTPADGYAILRIKDFKVHPIYCFFLGRFFIGVFKLAEPRFKEITVKETKCMFKGDPYHEYLIEWSYK